LTLLKNEDILLEGRQSLSDSFPNPTTKIVERQLFDVGIITRINPNGTPKWTHYRLNRRKDGSNRILSIINILELDNGDLMTVGALARDNGKIPQNNNYDAWIGRTNANGCFGDTCTYDGIYWRLLDLSLSSATEDLPTSQQYEPLSLSPVPATSSLTLRPVDDVAYPIQYRISTIEGQQIEVGLITTSAYLDIDVSYLPSGTYIMHTRDKSGKVSVGKWIKM
jgi:hypothetical protein